MLVPKGSVGSIPTARTKVSRKPQHVRFASRKDTKRIDTH
jgi:hypothetical protein